MKREETRSIWTFYLGWFRCELYLLGSQTGFHWHMTTTKLFAVRLELRPLHRSLWVPNLKLLGTQTQQEMDGLIFFTNFFLADQFNHESHWYSCHEKLHFPRPPLTASDATAPFPPIVLQPGGRWWPAGLCDKRRSLGFNSDNVWKITSSQSFLGVKLGFFLAWVARIPTGADLPDSQQRAVHGRSHGQGVSGAMVMAMAIHGSI